MNVPESVNRWQPRRTIKTRSKQASQLLRLALDGAEKNLPIGLAPALSEWPQWSAGAKPIGNLFVLSQRSVPIDCATLEWSAPSADNNVAHLLPLCAPDKQKQLMGPDEARHASSAAIHF